MNLKIEFTDLPEFKNNLEISISLKRDSNGKVGEDVKIFPDTVTNTIQTIPQELLSESKELLKEEKKETVKKGRKSKISVAGEGIEAKVSNSTEISKPNESLSTSSDSSTSPVKKSKFSGNMMNLDF